MSDEEEETPEMQFIAKLMEKSLEFVITKGAFNVLCDTTTGYDYVNITAAIYWAFWEIGLVWRDVLERVDNCEYVALTVKALLVKKTVNKNLFGQFVYKDQSFFFDCVENTWTICLMSER